MNSFLKIYVSDGIIVEAYLDSMKFEQPAGQRTDEYVHDLWTKALRYIHVYDEYHLKGTFIERLRQLI